MKKRLATALIILLIIIEIGVVLNAFLTIKYKIEINDISTNVLNEIYSITQILSLTIILNVVLLFILLVRQFDIIKSKQSMISLSILLLFASALQSCENKKQKEVKNNKNNTTKVQDISQNGSTEEWTKEKDEEIAGIVYSKFDNDSIEDKFMFEKNDDEIIQSFLSISLSSLKKDVKINILNNSILYNNKESDYYQFMRVINDKICEVRVEYANQESVPNMYGERRNLVEKIKYRFIDKNNKIQIIGYDLSYQKDTIFITKSFNFITGKYIAMRKEKGQKNVTANGWSAEFENNIYTEDWNLSFMQNTIFWTLNEIEPS